MMETVALDLMLAQPILTGTGFSHLTTAPDIGLLFGQMIREKGFPQKTVTLSDWVTLQVPVLSFYDWLAFIHIGRKAMYAKNENGLFRYNESYGDFCVGVCQDPSEALSLIDPTMGAFREWFELQNKDFDEDIVAPIVKADGYLQNLAQKIDERLDEDDEELARLREWFEDALFDKLRETYTLPYRDHQPDENRLKGRCEVVRLFYLQESGLYGWAHFYWPY